MQVAGGAVTAAGNHPFFVVSGEDLFSRPVPEELAHEPATTTAYSLFGRWVEARDLRVGDRLLGPDGDSLPISVLASETKTLFVYNLNVVSPDTFLISSIGLVVHNADKCGADAPKGGTKGTSNPPHGNTLDNRPATLYEKYDKDGNFLKHGITKHEDPSKRYTKAQIGGGEIRPIERGPRAEIAKKERDRVERSPGPENREPWAGKRAGEDE